MFSVKVIYCQVSMKFIGDEEISSEGSQCDSHGSQSSTQERRKLLKRTRSLAVISEDDSRYTREIPHFQINEPNFNLTRRPQLIPRAKLIDRNSLKDRLSKSQQHLSDSYDKFTDTRSYQSCTLYAPPPLTLLPDPLPYVRGHRSESDRLNILDWPDPSRKYCSVQNLDTVSGLVEIVEDNWPLEENRSLDCIYTQVKRKRKEHRSLDSILFEDDDELEYFDVLNLLPISNSHLEESTPKLPSRSRCKERDEFFDGILTGSDKESIKDFFSTTGNNETDEEKSKNQEDEVSDPRKGFWIDLVSPTKQERKDFWERIGSQEQKKQEKLQEQKLSEATILDDTGEQKEEEKGVETIPEQEQIISPLNETKITHNSEEKLEEFQKIDVQEEPTLFQARNPFPRPITVNELSKTLADKYKTNVAIVTPCEEKFKVEEAEDVRSIWISDEEEEMSRRPQVLKIIDNDLTKRCNKTHQETPSEELIETKKSIETARNFFEKKSIAKDTDSPTEGRFERIVKETSNIFGKACNVVKGTLGFEAHSESSDLGLGSDIGSIRRQSVDDSKEKSPGKVETKTELQKQERDTDELNYKNRTNLTRSRSCVDSLECQGEPEFNHVRYKIVKSNLFGKSIFSTSTGDVTYEGLMDYLREYSFQELLLDNNVVIIEPVRAEVERKPSMNVKSKSLPTCRVSGATQKKRDSVGERKNFDEKSRTCPRQGLIRKHFFYHPIRINKELIDDELPNPDTVKNVTRMFEETFRAKKNLEKDTKSLSMKDLSGKDSAKDEDREFYDGVDKLRESRSRSSSRAKDLTRHFESLEKKTISSASIGGKDEPGSPRSESKTRILAQSFEARSGHTSPSDSNFSNKNRMSRFHQNNRHHNWDAGSVSSGVSSDYPDTDNGSAPPCTSSEDEEIDCQDEEVEDDRDPGHYVSQDVLRKIRECGTSITYYGGKVVNSYNGPIISPLNNKLSRRRNQLQDYVKFRLVKSNSCDSRLELTGKVVEEKVKVEKNSDLRQCTIAEMPSIELSSMERQEMSHEEIKESKKKEPPVVIGSEPKKDEGKGFRADFKLGKIDESNSRFSALSKWQINENGWRKNTEFDKMEFEEFEILEDSLNGIDNQS
ncbi:protein javelin isoform X2 [Leptopilina heterotoma]|uniref:protein javelin isoform X2 n=1 Tax=Leptopilina heterotoma TaxID=63436 RepID=UPI001CA82240|nr:protein javelin isoform X2 [Leptopilina heterotoma]